jgi:PAS domain S-box-containing protein
MEATEAKRRSELLELLIEQVVDYAIFVIDRDGNIASWNPGAQRIKGYTRDEIVGQSYGVFFTAEDRAAGKPNRILSAVRERGRYEEEGWRVRKDGSRFWASIVVTALRDDSGELRGFAKITRDLTERRRADEDARRAAEERAARRQAELDQDELRRSRDQLNLILKSIAEGVTAQRPDGTLVFANEAAAQLAGFASVEEILAAPLDELRVAYEMFHEDGTPLSFDELPGQRALQGETSTLVVRSRVKRTGDERWMLVSAVPVVDAEGRVELAVNVFRDITERRRVEEAWQFLAEASVALGPTLDYRATLEKVATLAVPRIADWCVVDILRADGTLEQVAAEHADPARRDLARRWRERWPPRRDSIVYRVVSAGRPELIAEIPPSLMEERAVDPEQRRVASSLGLRSAMVVPLTGPGSGQSPFGVLSFLTAHSGRRYGPQDLILATEVARRASLAIENARAYAEARAAVQTRDNFLAIASHELRTPLSAMTVTMTSLVRAATSGRLSQLAPEALKDRLVTAQRGAQQLARLIDRLLDVSRLSTGDLRLEREPTDLAEIARDVAARFDDTGRAITVAASGPTVGLWDRSRIDQVVTNLVSNAVKYGCGTPVTVSVSGGQSGNVRLTVRDEGPGVPPEDQERIFGQFERSNQAEGLPGMGLGLWLVRRIVAAHGGTISLESRPGRGASFTIVLPLGQVS